MADRYIRISQKELVALIEASDREHPLCTRFGPGYVEVDVEQSPWAVAFMDAARRAREASK